MQLNEKYFLHRVGLLPPTIPLLINPLRWPLDRQLVEMQNSFQQWFARQSRCNRLHRIRIGGLMDVVETIQIGAIFDRIGED